MKTCDNASVGIMMFGSGGRLLTFTRNTPPAGIAPCAGHVFDDHAVYRDGELDPDASYLAAAVAEAREELGVDLAPADLRYVTGGWRPGACRRQPGPRGFGHEWKVYRAHLAGDLHLDPSTRETRDVKWRTWGEVQLLAHTTMAYLHGFITADEFAARPGIEPVWLRWLAAFDVVQLPQRDLDFVESFLHDQREPAR